MAHRALGYAAVDAVVDHLTTLRDSRATGCRFQVSEARRRYAQRCAVRRAPVVLLPVLLLALAACVPVVGGVGPNR